MSQQRGGFRLDATTMGLKVSKLASAVAPPSPSPSPVVTPRDLQPPDGQEKQEAQEPQPPATAVDHTQCNPNLEPLPTSHFSGRVQKLRHICGDGAKMNFEMNEMFLKRLESIDAQSGGDASNTLRLVTLQDWVDQLLHVNYILFDNMSALEMEAYKKIMDCFQSTRGEQQQALDENRLLRKDICAITKFVQNAYHNNDWNTNDLCLETMNISQLLRTDQNPCPESESEKVAKNIKSLVNEVAAKHDEVCQLQSQLVTMDEFVRTARQKIIFKDTCIEQLNQQIADLQTRVSKLTKDSSTMEKLLEKCPQEELSSDQDLPSCLFDGLNEWDQRESELFRMLNIELSEFIDLVNRQDFPAIERRRKLLTCFFEKMNLDRSTAERNLANLRSQLRMLECGSNQDEQLAVSTKSLEDECDIQLVESLRRRLQDINECNKELNTKYQQVEGQYKAQLLELTYTHKAEQSINQKNCLALKQIAELLSKLRSSDLSYKEIYTEESSDNPFCKAIMEMHDKLTELENSTDKEQLRLNTNDTQ